MYSKQAWDSLLKEKKEKKDLPKTDHFSVRAAADAQVLTGSQEWNQYLTYLQGLLETSNDQIAGLKEKLLSPDLFDHQQIIKLKSQLIRFEERSEVLRFTMSLPKDIIEHGKVARKKLKELTT